MSLASIDESQFSDPHTRDCARVFMLVSRCLARSRPEISEALRLRSTTTSRVVAELIEKGLIQTNLGEKSGRGRPAALLTENLRRIGVSVVHVASQSLAGALVDMNGDTIASRTCPVPQNVGTDDIAAILQDIAVSLANAVPDGMEHAGTAVSLSGLLDLQEKHWRLSSRWPLMRGLNIPSALPASVGPIDICRNLDAELRARVALDRTLSSGSALLLHWGWGIGLAYAVNGQTFAPAGGSFGEIGHWHISALHDRNCGCGNTGCLETGAALWSLLPLLRQHWPELAENEATLYEQLAGLDLVKHQEVDMASRLLARALGNVCRLLFPSQITITGPFVANPRLWTHFKQLFRDEGTMGGHAMPRLIREPSSQSYEIHGAAAPLLNRAIESLLTR